VPHLSVSQWSPSAGPGGRADAGHAGRRVALLAGRSLRDVLIVMLQALALTAVAVGFGLRAPVGVILGLLLLGLGGGAMSAVSYSVALLVKSEDSLASLLNSFTVPALLLSGILLQMSLAPGWLYGLSRISPFTYVVNAETRAVLVASERCRVVPPAIGLAPYTSDVSTEREELARLVEELPGGEVADALAEVRRHLLPVKDHQWPPAWFGIAPGDGTPAGRRSEELLAEGFGE
jgi:hypothetical protein